MKETFNERVLNYINKNKGNVNELLKIKDSFGIKSPEQFVELQDIINEYCSNESISIRDRLILYFALKEDAYNFMTIKDALSLQTAEDFRMLQIELEKLCNEYVIYHTKKDKYILYEKIPNIKKGRLQVKGNYGFLLLSKETGEDDIYISSDNFNYALDGDYILVEVRDSKDNKSGRDKEGIVIKVLERDLNNIVGEIKRDNNNNLYFEPKEKKNLIINIDSESLKTCVEGEIVCVNILECDKKNRCTGVIANHICHKDDPGQDILTVAAMNDIFVEFPKEVMEQIETIPNEVSQADFKDRVDLRDEVIFTIDGADTKDIDDAISYSYDPATNTHTLGVHIADVSYYVKEGTALDQEAFNRGTSNYLADTVIPMLPHKLSNGICSLNEDVDRCAISCIMKIDDRSMNVDSKVFLSVIHSKKKMTYDNVNEILEQDNIPEGYEEFADTLKGMQILAHKLRKQRSNHGASDFDVPEGKCICDENGKCIDVIKRDRGEGEKLIEDFMIAANEAVARKFAFYDLPSIYRIHEEPNPDKVQQYIQNCELMGIHIKGKFKTVTPVMFQKLFKQVVDGCGDDKDKRAIMASLAVRCTPKAIYSEYNSGHFGLASTCYTHFTSPIRRLCDFYVHRLIHKLIIEGKIRENENSVENEKITEYYEGKVAEVAKQASDREQIAVKAEREVDKMKMAEYMEDHIGEEYPGVITGIEKYGFYVQLPNLVEGLVPIQSVKGDYYEYVEELNSFIGKSTKQRYSLGDRVDVKCVNASKEAKQIDFELTKVLNREIEDDIKVLKKI